MNGVNFIYKSRIVLFVLIFPFFSLQARKNVGYSIPVNIGKKLKRIDVKYGCSCVNFVKALIIEKVSKQLAFNKQALLRKKQLAELKKRIENDEA